MQYCGWPTNVNKRIIDKTNVTVGDGATITDNIEGSPKTRSRLTCANPSDKFSVTMHFECYEKDENGKTEKDRFFEWFKGVHKYGTVPFEFPSILWNSNSKWSFDTEEVARGNLPFLEHYKISSPVEGSKYGFFIEVTMTWETVATGIYEIPYDEAIVTEIEFHDSYGIVQMQNIPKTMPVTANFQVQIDDVDVVHSVYSNEDSVPFFYIVYPRITDDETHNVKVFLKSGIKGEDSYSGTIKKGK